MHTVDLDILPILVAGAAGWIVGAVWYGVFSKPWMALAHPGKKREDMQGAGPGYVIALVCFLVMAAVLAAFMRYYDAANIGDGIVVGLMAWAGFVATALLLNFTFSQRPFKLYLIDVGNYLVAFVVMGAVLGAWQ